MFNKIQRCTFYRYCYSRHDEIIIETDLVFFEVICEQMSKTPSLEKGIVLSKDGYEFKFYKKIK